jgi:hypothetical protein
MGEEPDPAATPDPPAADPGALEPMASRCVATVSPADTWESRGIGSRVCVRCRLVS